MLWWIDHSRMSHGLPTWKPGAAIPRRCSMCKDVCHWHCRGCWYCRTSNVGIVIVWGAGGLRPCKRPALKVNYKAVPWTQHYAQVALWEGTDDLERSSRPPGRTPGGQEQWAALGPRSQRARVGNRP